MSGKFHPYGFAFVFVSNVMITFETKKLPSLACLFGHEIVLLS